MGSQLHNQINKYDLKYIEKLISYLKILIYNRIYGINYMAASK